MRRTKQRRRFHTERVIRNRQRAALAYRPLFPRDLEDGRLANHNAHFACLRPRCFVCHFDKLIGDRRTREKRLWRQEVDEQSDYVS